MSQGSSTESDRSSAGTPHGGEVDSAGPYSGGTLAGGSLSRRLCGVDHASGIGIGWRMVGDSAVDPEELSGHIT